MYNNRKFKSYRAAYKLGTRLVLISEECGTMKREEYDMRLMDVLAVSRNTKLKCGVECPIIHEVIHYTEEEKMREILTPEAYELYINLKKEER